MAFLLSWNIHEMCMIFSISIWCLFSYIQCICHLNFSQASDFVNKKYIKNSVLCENCSESETITIKPVLIAAPPHPPPFPLKVTGNSSE